MSSERDDKSAGAEKIVPTVCASHCGGSCLLKVHVKDGVITRIETDDEDAPQLRACLRGRAYRQRVYAPDRLKYPMKRVGARGEGKFERISWDEALDTVAGEIRRVKETYGSSAILYWVSGGDQGALHDAWRRMSRLFCLMGGYSRPWGLHSYEGAIFAELTTYGNAWVTDSRDNLLNSRLIILWGWDPANTIADTNTIWYLVQAKEAGIRIISIDPRYTDTTATLAHEWIPIRPGTDAAMLIAMANVIVRENLQNQAFLDTYTIGFDAFKDYILGVEDGVPKTPDWAEAITGVPAATIYRLAREYATTKPAALLAGIAPGRTAYGEQYHRAAIVLSAMTGNVGIAGGSAAGKVWSIMPVLRMGLGLRIPPNAVDAETPPPKDKLPSRGTGYVYGHGAVNVFRLTDAILNGKSGGYPADYKLIYLNNSNIVNQWPNSNRVAEALKKLEFVVVEEQFMTATARFADIVLPICTFLERNEVTSGLFPFFYGYRNKIIEPLYESKSPLEIANELAARLGISDYNDKTEEELLRQIVQGSDVPDYDTFKAQGIFRVRLPTPYIALNKEISDPVNNPFPTPSGKIEIYSQQLADIENPKLPPVPKYIETWESPNDPLASKYPLQLITTHFKRRAHTQFDNIPWLRELEPQAIKINTIDAQARGIQDGDLVRVFNDRGRMIIPARVTERIMPGVVDLPQGAWYRPDENGVDRGGCANTLTRDEPSPGGALASNTALVEVEKYRG
jgi:anaerobic dimethyl sulfoxide reductase subunit A